MTRADGRELDQLREIEIVTGVQKDPAGSVQISFGKTIVLVAASVSDRLPGWLEHRRPRQGWITAEYAMLPGAVPGRAPRKAKGRSEEIQRLVGRSLRAAADLTELAGFAITVDCDVLQADGGTRTASITGGWVALELACRKLVADGRIQRSPIIRPIAAVSCGILDGRVLLDPDYSEDSNLDADLNLVFTEGGLFIEVQGTAEGLPFGRNLLDRSLDLARDGANQLFEFQKQALG